MRKISSGLLAVCACLTAIMLAGCGVARPAGDAPAGMNDVDFARTGFTALANGDMAAEGYISWTTFKAPGVDVGKQYNSLGSDAARTGFRNGFIGSFSRSFKQKRSHCRVSDELACLFFELRRDTGSG